MINWLLKTLALNAINRLLKTYNEDVQKFLTMLDHSRGRIQRIAGLLQSLKKRLHDGTITPEEIHETINDVKQTVQEW